MSTELDQEKIDENGPAALKEDQGKIDEDAPAALKEDQGKIDEDAPAALKEDQGKIDEDAPAALKEDQEKIDEDAPDVLLKESDMKQEGSDSISVYTISDAEEEIDLTCPTPKTVPIAVPITGLYLNNLNELDSEFIEQKRCSSEPLTSPIPIVDLPRRRRYRSVPKELRITPRIIDYISLLDSDTDSEISLEQKPKQTLKRKRSLIPTNIEIENTRKTMKPGPKSKTRNIVTVHQMITEAKLMGNDVTIDFSDTSDDDIELDADSEGCSSEDESFEEEEEISKIDLVDDGDDENSNETDDENEIVEDEELPTINVIGDCITISSTDDEADHLEPEVRELIVASEASISSDNFAMEILLSLSNEVTINKKSSETLDDKSNATEALENVIDSNKMISDNKALENNAIEQNKIEDKNVESHEINSIKITEDENYNNEILKNGE